MGRIGELLASQGYDPDDVERREEMYTCITVFFFVAFIAAQALVFVLVDPPKFAIFITAGTFYLFFFSLLSYTVDFASDDFTSVHQKFKKLHTTCWKRRSLSNNLKLLGFFIEAFQILSCVNHLGATPFRPYVPPFQMFGSLTQSIEFVLNILVLQWKNRGDDSYPFFEEFAFTILLFFGGILISCIALKLHVSQMDKEANAEIELPQLGNKDSKNEDVQMRCSKCLEGLKRFAIKSLFGLCDIALPIAYLPMLYHTSAAYSCNYDNTRKPGEFWQFSYMPTQTCFKGAHAAFLLISMLVQVCYTCVFIVFLIFGTRQAGLTTFAVYKPNAEEQLYFKKNPYFEIMICITLSILVGGGSTLTVANVIYEIGFEAGGTFLIFLLAWWCKSANNMFVNILRCFGFLSATVFAVYQLVYALLNPQDNPANFSYNSTVIETVIASNKTSTLNKVEASIENGAWVGLAFVATIVVLAVLFSSIIPVAMVDDDKDPDAEEPLLHPCDFCQINLLSLPNCCPWCLKVSWRLSPCPGYGLWLFLRHQGRPEHFPDHLLVKLYTKDDEEIAQINDKSKNKNAQGGNGGNSMQDENNKGNPSEEIETGKKTNEVTTKNALVKQEAKI